MSKGYLSEEGLENYKMGTEFVVWPVKSRHSVVEINYIPYKYLREEEPEQSSCPSCGEEL